MPAGLAADPPFRDAAVAAVFAGLVPLKWGQPSYLTSVSKGGTTIRIGPAKGEPGRVALYVHCQTHLIDRFRERYGDTLSFEGKRAILLDVEAPLPVEPLRHCIALALTYHRDKRGRVTASRGA